MPPSANYYKTGKFKCRSIILKRRKIHNCRPMFRQDSCLRALFLPWREVESRQNTTVSLSWGCQGQVWRGGGSIRNKKGQSSMEEGQSVFGWGLLWCLRQQLGYDVQGKTQDHLWVWKPSRYKRSCNRKMLRNVKKDHEFSSILILLKIWVWASSGCWWWTGMPGMLQSMGSQRVGHDWVTELRNKTEFSKS